MSEDEKKVDPLPEGWEIDPEAPDDEAGKALVSRGWVTILIVASITVAVGLVAAAMLGLFDSIEQKEVPIIKAEETEIKQRPEDPGGAKIPDQDKQVYNQLGENAQEPEVERLLPPPEAPALPPSETPASPSSETPAPALPETLDLASEAQRPLRFPDNISPPQIVQQGQSATPQLQSTPLKLPPEAASESPPKADPEALPEIKAVVETVPTPVVNSAPKPGRDEAVGQTVPQKAPAPVVNTPPPAPVVNTPAPAATPTPVAVTDDLRYRNTVPKGSYMVQVAALRNQEAAKTLGRKLRNAHPDILGSLSDFALRADLGSKGVFYRIRFGPLSSAETARDVCQRLKARKQDCLVVKF